MQQRRRAREDGLDAVGRIATHDGTHPTASTRTSARSRAPASPALAAHFHGVRLDRRSGGGDVAVTHGGTMPTAGTFRRGRQAL
eukprot:scaffold1371_cov122-Isochrysis_galbana.AAC.2